MIFVKFSFLVLFIIDGTATARSKKQPAQNIKLYSFFVSPPCRAVLLTAKMLGIEFEVITINPVAGETKTPEFLKMNPQHTVPTIDDNGFILWESRAIMAYLVNAYGKNDDLYPKNPRLRALIDHRLQFDLGTLYRRTYSLYIPMLFAQAKYDEEKAAKLNEALKWLDIFLENRVFVAGDNFSIADITMVVTMSNLEAFGHDYKEHKNVIDWYERSKKVLEPYDYEDLNQLGADMLASFLPE